MNSIFEIYNASAGSGKTFTLTSRYLVKFLGSSENESFKKILALTFTNKASEEMKNRILSSLKEFSNRKNGEDPSFMLKEVQRQLGISYDDIVVRSKKRLTLLLHNYSFFNVSTLDSFSHNIIRSFSKDLKIASDFRVILDSEELINESIETLLNQVGKEKDVTKALLDFANSKISEGKSWDITFDLKELSILLENENHYNKIKVLNKKTLKDFMFLKDKMIKEQNELEKKIENQANLSFDLIKGSDTEIVFSRNSFPVFLGKLKNKSFKKINLESISRLLEKKAIITKKSALGREKAVSELTSNLAETYKKIEKALSQWELLKGFYDSLGPLSLLNKIEKISKKIQKEKGELMIGEFNKIINEEIKEHPAPYIFEKIGNKYKHYLIDEFQDTSTLQWRNLVPLISHSIESAENDNDLGSLLLVGDPKQSLYRWRGANPDMFFSLINNESPFSISGSIKPLMRNYRSCNSIILFNNGLFDFVSKNIDFTKNKELYRLGNHQELNNKKGGLVSLDFTEKQKDKTITESFILEKVLKIIKDCKSRGFELSDQSILVRNKNQQKLIADFLLKNNIAVISAEALLIKSSLKVSLLIEVIRLRLEPDNLSSRRTVIKYFVENKSPVDVFEFYKNLLNENITNFFKILFEMSFKEYVNLSFYDAMITVQRKLGFDFEEDAHVQFLNEELLGFLFSSDGNEKQFLDYWDNNQDKLNVVMSGAINAIQILTIHKAKGLEFPVVIYPFADSTSHKPNTKKVWLPYCWRGEEIDLLIPYSKTIVKNGETGLDLFNRIEREEELDNINILYVALTRAVNESYIIASSPKTLSMSSHNGLLMSYVKHLGIFKSDKLNYVWGEKIKKYSLKTTNFHLENNINLDFFKTDYIPKLNSFYKDDQTLFGDLFHEFISKIEYSFQFLKEEKAFRNKKNVSMEVLDKIIFLANKTINHKILSEYFTKKYSVICEKEIFTNKKEIIVPDRIAVSQDLIYTIIEFKTGKKRKEDILQTKKYSNTLLDMGLNVEKSILVYILPSLEVIQL